MANNLTHEYDVVRNIEKLIFFAKQTSFPYLHLRDEWENMELQNF